MVKPTQRNFRAFDTGNGSHLERGGLFAPSAGRSARRRRKLNGSLGVESLETRVLLSLGSASLVKDINSVDVYPSQLTPAGTNLFYTLADSAGTGVELAVTTSSGGSTMLHDFTAGTSAFEPDRSREQHIFPGQQHPRQLALDQRRDRTRDAANHVLGP